MKQKRYRWSFLLLAAVMLLFGAVTVHASETTGQTGSQTTTVWFGSIKGTITNGVLTVTGSGPIPDYVSTNSPIYGCRTLINKIVITNGITQIGKYAFENTSCTSIEIGPDVMYIRKGAFSKSPNLQSVIIPSKVVQIGSNAFSECGRLSNCVLNEGLKTIGNHAFYKTSLSSVRIPKTVEKILGKAFYDTPLTSVEIPDKVTLIETKAFGKVNAMIYGRTVTFGNQAFGGGSVLTVLQGTATEANAKAKGFTVNCFECMSSSGVPLPKHTLDAGVVTKEATCVVQGEKTHTCSVCHKTVIEYLPLVEHTYGDWRVVTQATVFEKGLRSRMCTVCGHMEVEDQERVLPTLSLNSDQVVLNVGGSYKLRVTVKSPGDYVAKWKSSNQKVATVTSSGKIKAKAPGKTTIKVRMDSGISASVKVIVQRAGTTDLAISVRGAKLKGKKVTVKAKKSFTLVAKVKPSNSADKVKFSSSNKKVATVSSGGKVTAKKKGRTRITIKSGRIKKTINVVVK